MTRLAAPPPQPVAVIDIGSNSGRVSVMRCDRGGHVEILADGRAALRLARSVDRDGRLTEEAITRTAAATRDFRAIGEAAGAKTWKAVATSAVRDSPNADELVDRVRRESGLALDVIDGDAEARWAFIGAVAGLNVEDGLTIDVGGGSMELVRFDRRKPIRQWTLPLGALRLSDRFLTSDPPEKEQVEALRAHVAGSLASADVEPLASGQRVVGTGGTFRNLAKMDRRRRPYPIPRLHGYVLTTRRLADLAELVSSRRASRRRSIAGLNTDRVDSIVGGALGTLVALESLGASELVVSGQGLREGIALDTMGHEPAPVEEVRRASIQALVSRFATWDPGRASRRVLIAARLQEALDPGASPKARERLEHAATILDIGRSIDFYERFRHASDVVIASDLAGFSHRQLALLAAVLRRGDDERERVREYAPLLGPADRDTVARAGALLAVADEIEHRTPLGGEGDVRWRTKGRGVVVRATVFDPWRRAALAARIKRAFGRSPTFEEVGAGDA
jgi:exopolyphosphatase / guanosine-5'-triphosphate,3'-diphosphate pyrophosphatase